MKNILTETITDQWIEEMINEPDRDLILYIRKTIEDRQFSPTVAVMISNYVRFMILESKSSEHRIESFESFFNDLLTDAFTPEARKYHAERFEELK